MRYPNIIDHNALVLSRRGTLNWAVQSKRFHESVGELTR